MHYNSPTIIFTLLLCLTLTIVECKLTCLSDDGKPVDMFILYKLPEIHWQEVPSLVKEGYGYTYLDSNNKKFRLSDNSIASPKSAAGRTLNQVYQKYTNEKKYHLKDSVYVDGPTDQAHVFYNDADPQGTEHFSFAHSKGALAFNEESGFWLINSVPKYPPAASEGYDYPHSGCMYGQMFMCVTFNSSAFNDIGLQLRYNHPHVHDANLPKGWIDQFPNMDKLLQGDVIHAPPAHRALLRSLAGVDYQHFAKSKHFGKDLYHEFVAPGLQTDILTETWQHGAEHNIGPSCNGDFTVEDVSDISIDVPDQHFSFWNNNDHSKFVVAKSSSKPFVCVGDINRQTTQFERGGGTLCTKDIDLWNVYNDLVANMTSCDDGVTHLNARLDEL
ncbi:plancitoxin-1-like [Hydractinia symbiolongicarpus]|uniref:plancitoxin-1-like n=1 Tax=Hydractinia symbiolongicarpus TaxID=13093 RepID=UPI00254A851D|nr:plancitoxin-1-like [Hydractinia symbiolongicarpus]